MKERQRDNNINKRLQFIGTAHTAPTRHRATRTLPHAPLSAFFSLRPFAARRPAPGRHKRQGDTPPDLGRASPAAPVPADPPRAAVRSSVLRTTEQSSTDNCLNSPRGVDGLSLDSSWHG